MSEKQSKIKKFFHSAFQVVWTPIALPIFLFTQYIMMLEKNRADKFNAEEDKKYRTELTNKLIERLKKDLELSGPNWKIHSLSYDNNNYNLENDYYYFTRNPNFTTSVVYTLTDKISGKYRLFENKLKHNKTTNEFDIVLTEIPLDKEEQAFDDLESYW